MSKYRKLLYIFDCSKEESIEYKLVKRSLIIKLLYKPIDKLKDLDIADLTLVYDQYPKFKQIITLVNNFRDLVKNKDLIEFEKWIKQTQELNIMKLNSFINGLNRDIDAVKNAIRYKYNNGLAEGHVNKLKVIKRIMYGRNKFKLLRTKLLFNNQ
jgi:transposase